MTSIIAFKADSGNQIIIVGDTKHTYLASTSEAKKIFKLNEKLVFCGAGYDSTINSIRNKLLSQGNVIDCEGKLLDLIRGDSYDDFQLYAVEGISKSDLLETSFIILGTEDLSVGIVEKNQSKEFEDMAIIGSGSEFIGQCQDKIKPLHEIKFDDSTKEIFLEKIFECFCDLGKHDPNTGHPALFKIEGYILERDSELKRFEIKFLHNPNDSSNYGAKIE